MLISVITSSLDSLLNPGTVALSYQFIWHDGLEIPAILLVLAAGLLMASGVWVGLVLIRAVIRIKPRTPAASREVPGSGSLMSRPDADQS